VLTEPGAAVAAYARHVNPAFVRLLGLLGYGRVFVRALDVWLWDDAGRRYLDFLAGFGAFNLGHNHPRLVRRLREALAGETPQLVHTAPSVDAARCAEALAARLAAPLEVALFATGGAEAVEAAVKLARAATGRTGVLSCEGAFHGLGLGTLSLMDAGRFRAPFEPLLPECERVPFGDLDALARALAGRRHAAFVVEPIQAEAGVRIPPPGYLGEAAALCRRHGTLVVLDEVQTGMGRTGARFAHERAGVVPDALVLGKALGGGIAPVAVTLTSPEIHARAFGTLRRFDLHGSTFAGYALGCVAAQEALAILDEEQLVTAAAERGAQLLHALRRLDGHPRVAAVRGEGLLIGVELRLPRLAGGRSLAGLFGQWVALRMLEAGVVCQPAALRFNVLKLEPPLTVGADDAGRVVGTLAGVLDEYRDAARFLADVTRRLGRQLVARWAFA
jgi:putrescine aminotransferase